MTPVALKTWLELLRDDDPDLTWVVAPTDRPFIGIDVLNVVSRANPRMLDELSQCSRVYIEHEVHALDEHTVVALLEVVTLYYDSKSSAA